MTNKMTKAQKHILARLTRMYLQSKFQMNLDFDEIYNLIGFVIPFDPKNDEFIDFTRQVKAYFEKMPIVMAA